MEKKRSSQEKIEKMRELGIFEKQKANTDAHTEEMYRRYDFPKDYIRGTAENQTYQALKRVCVPVRYDRVFIHILKIPGRFWILGSYSNRIKRRNLGINR